MTRRGGVAILLCVVAAVPALAVIPVAGNGVIAPAHYFDLQRKTLWFTPSGRGYVLATSKARPPGELGTKLGWPDFTILQYCDWRADATRRGKAREANRRAMKPTGVALS